MSRGLVELHGGRLAAESPGPGQGSTFTAWLPLASSASDARSLVDDGASRPGAQGGRRCLVVEDNADAAESLGELLRLLGHEVQVVTSGASAVAAARAFRPDLVLCDVGLPGLDGYAVARALRADPALGPLRLVAVTGYGREEDRRRAREAGFDDHLVKPLTLEALSALLVA